MVARGVVATTNKARTIEAIDARKMVKSQYEATTNLSLTTTFVAFCYIFVPSNHQ
jgi:hypothetical protein